MIIGLGGKKGSGKSHCAEDLVRHGWYQISVANYLKESLSKVFSINRIFFYSPILKEEFFSEPLRLTLKQWQSYCSYIGLDLPYQDIEIKNIRHLMEYVGTDCIRRIDPDFHINKTLETITYAKQTHWVIDDLRFLNEIKAVTDIGGHTIYIRRPEVQKSTHEAENSVSEQDFQHIIDNSKTLKYLMDNFVNLVESLRCGIQ